MRKSLVNLSGLLNAVTKWCLRTTKVAKFVVISYKNFVKQKTKKIWGSVPLNFRTRWFWLNHLKIETWVKFKFNLICFLTKITYKTHKYIKQKKKYRGSLFIKLLFGFIEPKQSQKYSFCHLCAISIENSSRVLHSFLPSALRMEQL